MTGNTDKHLLVTDVFKKKSEVRFRKPVSIWCDHHLPHTARHISFTYSWSVSWLWPVECCSTPPVENAIDWTCFGKAHAGLYKVPQLTVHVRAKTKPWGWRNCPKSSKTGLCRGTKTLPRSCRPAKLSNSRVQSSFVEMGEPSRRTTISTVLHQSEAGTGRLVRIEGKRNGAKYREMLDENLL